MNGTAESVGHRALSALDLTDARFLPFDSSHPSYTVSPAHTANLYGMSSLDELMAILHEHAAKLNYIATHTGEAITLTKPLIPSAIRDVVANFPGGAPPINESSNQEVSLYDYYYDRIVVSSRTGRRAWLLQCSNNPKMVGLCNEELQLTDDQQYSRHILHELAHATGARKRLNRWTAKWGFEFGSPLYMLEEIVAETTAMNVAEALGILTPDWQRLATAYVELYSPPKRKIDPLGHDLLQAALADTRPLIRQATNYLLHRQNPRRRKTTKEIDVSTIGQPIGTGVYA